MRCVKCGNTEVFSRKNYTHGKRSKGKTMHICPKCGITEIEVPKVFKRRR